MPRIINALCVIASVAIVTPSIAATQAGQSQSQSQSQSQPGQQQQSQQPAAPTAAAPQTPGTQQPPRTQPPAEQTPAPTPTPTAPAPGAQPQPNPGPTTQPTGIQPPATTPAGGGPGTPAIGGAATPQPVTPARDVDHSAAVTLLERMQSLVDGALSGKPKDKSKEGDAVGTTGKSEAGLPGSGKVSVDRATLDEIRAEIAQIKMMLQR